jgi:hypothetical protein
MLAPTSPLIHPAPPSPDPTTGPSLPWLEWTMLPVTSLERLGQPVSLYVPLSKGTRCGMQYHTSDKDVG